MNTRLVKKSPTVTETLRYSTGFRSQKERHARPAPACKPDIVNEINLHRV